MKHEGQLIFFAGTGGTGKTLLAEAVEQNLEIKRVPSPTRDFYKEQKVATEQDLYTRTAEFRQQFQRTLYDFSIRKIYEATVNQADSMVFERSPICNLGYLLLNNPQFTVEEVDEALFMAKRTFLDLVNDGWRVLLVSFPYPTSWIRQKKNVDNFRLTQGGKDMMIHAAMRHFFWAMPDLIGLKKLTLSEKPIAEWVEDIKSNIV